jgi:hypothetical protein
MAAPPTNADYGLDAPGVVIGNAVGGAAALAGAGIGWAVLRRRHRVPAAVLGGWLAAWGLVGLAQAGLMVRSSRAGKLTQRDRLLDHDHTRHRGHGRVEVRRLQVTTVAGLGFPRATQAIRITRRVRSLRRRRWRTVTVYAVTNLTAAQASPARLADWIRGHWGIEALHHLRDTTFAEDAAQVRTGNAPTGHGQPAQPGHRHPAPPRHRNIAAGLRRNARDATRVLPLLGITGR